MPIVLAIIMVVASAMPAFYAREVKKLYRNEIPVQFSVAQDSPQQQHASPIALRPKPRLVTREHFAVVVSASKSDTADTYEEHIQTGAEPVAEPTPIAAPMTHTSAVAKQEPVPKQSPASAYATYSNTVIAKIHTLTNQERAQAGLSPLTHDVKLAAIAAEHSNDMYTDDYFAHTTPGGCTLTCRFANAHYQALSWGENIAWIQGDSFPAAEDLADTFMHDWMQSDGHRENILTAKFTHTGIGITRVGNTLYATVNFATP